MESVHDLRSQKPLRPTLWSLLLGILQTGMGLHRKKIFFFKSINTITFGFLIENWIENNKELDLKMDG